MSEHETSFVCSEMQKQLLPSNSLQTGVQWIEHGAVALVLGLHPRTLMRGVWGSESPKQRGNGGKSPGIGFQQSQDMCTP